jgi:hypothetical protein
MKSLRFILLLVVSLAACTPVAPQTPTAAFTTGSAITLTVSPTETGTAESTTMATPRCQPPGYPGTIHYANGDNFGDGYIARVRIEDATNNSQEEIVTILVTQWLDHYKTQSQVPSATIKDYSVDKINLLNPFCDQFFEIVAGVRFSIIPVQVPNDYVGFPGEAINPNDVWWQLSAPFGIFKDGEFYRLRLVFGWGT